MALTDADRAHLARCLELAERGRRTAAPNPVVGAVVVRDGSVIGEGWHERPGGPHAEIVALRAAGDAAGATVYTSLEPCSHHGRTPPCADALIAAGVSRVVAAMIDPTDKVDGAGAARLREAGVVVDIAGGDAERAGAARERGVARAGAPRPPARHLQGRGERRRPHGCGGRRSEVDQLGGEPRPRARDAGSRPALWWSGAAPRSPTIRC